MQLFQLCIFTSTCRLLSLDTGLHDGGEIGEGVSVLLGWVIEYSLLRCNTSRSFCIVFFKCALTFDAMSRIANCYWCCQGELLLFILTMEIWR